MKELKFQIYLFALIMVSAIILLAELPGCENKKPIKVGFVGCLTGRLLFLIDV